MQLVSGKVGCLERCSTSWKTAGDWRLDLELQRNHPQLVKTTKSKSRKKNEGANPGHIRMAFETRATAISHAPPSPSNQSQDVSSWMTWSWASRSCTAVGAGRSKAKKGKASGGRIEQKPSTIRQRETPNSQPQPAGQEQGQEQVQGQGQAQRQMRRDAVRTEEDEMNRTWQEAGLGDRRSGGKFRANAGEQRKEATRVGGWGRDKSMQRALSSEQQRAESLRERGRQRKEGSPSPVVQRKGKKPYEGFDSSPRGEHLPEYYKYGPYGPFAWKGITVGKLVEGEMHTDNVVFFTHVDGEAEHEDRDMANVAVEYTKAVAEFDEDVGIQYFYAFARRRVGPRSEPWQDWTLVAQIAVESGANFDEQGKLFTEMGSWSQDLTVQCVAWARPDLTYVRRPKFQLRLEPQEQFLTETMNLVDSEGPGSYYATLCRLVNVKVGDSAESVRRGYEALDEQGKMECLKHIFTRHPVKILASARYDRQLMEEQEGRKRENGSANGSALDTEEEGLGDEDEGDESHKDSRQFSKPRWNFAESLDGKEGQQVGAQDWRSENQRSHNPRVGLNDTESIPKTTGSTDLPWSDSRALLHVFGPPRSVHPRKVVYTKRRFKSAVRPFSYANLVEEIAQMRELVSDEESVVYSVANVIF